MSARTRHKNILLIISLLGAIIIVVLLLIFKTDQPIVQAGETDLVLPEVTPSTPPTHSSSLIATIEPHTALTSDNIIWYTNYYRAQYGLKPLTLSPQLRNAAYYKSMDMFKYQYFDHYRPSNQLGFDNFIDNQHYVFIKVGENLAQGNSLTTSKAVVDAWMKSPEHRRNILDPNYTEIGVSVDSGILNGGGIILITQHLAKPSNECPLVNAALNTAIKKLTTQLIKIKKVIDASENNPTELINQYNEIIKERAALVEQYNGQVTAFDTCVSRGI